MRLQRLLVLFLLTAGLFPFRGWAQLSSLREMSIPVRADSVQLDTLSIAPGTFQLRRGSGEAVDSSAYRLDWVQGRLYWLRNAPAYQALSIDSVRARFRVFSFLFNNTVRHKDPQRIARGTGGAVNPFVYEPGAQEPMFFRSQGLQRSGTISRGITFGNNQDVFVNSSLNLQLGGKLNDNVEIVAAITDENIPIQPEGNTQQLQEFDRVFIQLNDERNRLIAGDFELRRPDSYFLNFFKRSQGGYFTTNQPVGKGTDGKPNILRAGLSAAVAKGRFARNTFTAQEGNQGPYRLVGNNGETFIIILAGTEKVYIDGALMQRGAQNDYVIDYNTAELAFTPRRLITNQSRIVIEFEYSDRNYVRSLYFLNTEYETRKTKVKLNFYSEQDSKNQPLLQDLDSAQQATMAAAGDNIQLAFTPTADSVAFDGTRVLYAKRDTIVGAEQFSIYVYSTNPDSAYWAVTFTETGPRQGDYILDVTSANGRVFRWVAPVNGIPQGNYIPERLLVTPKRLQILTIGNDWQLDARNRITLEGAFSRNDINLFSRLDKANDDGYATRITFNNQTPLSADTARGWRLDNMVSYEYVARDFKPFDRFRPVEFTRDWNTASVTQPQDEHLAGLQSTLVRPEFGSVGLQVKTFQRGSQYNGLLNGMSTRINWKKIVINSDGSLLSTSGSGLNTRYLRHIVDVSRAFGPIILGLREYGEYNRFRSDAADTLLASSFGWQEWQGSLGYADTSRGRIQLSYKKRYDFGPFGDLLRQLTEADEASLQTEFSRNPKHTLRTTTTYRELRISDTTRTTQEPAKTLLNRIDHSLTLFKNILNATTYFEIGTGQERRQEFYYLEVPAGQGTYAWLGDLNGNGVKDLDEFAISNFPDQAKYVRVSVNTNDYITVRSNQFSEVLNINPAAARTNYSGKPRFIEHFSNQFLLRLDKRTRGEELLSSLNPFSRRLDDSLLVTMNSSYRNMFFINRNDPVWGMDYTWQQNRNKSFLSNGFESRTLTTQSINGRWNMSQHFQLSGTAEQELRENNSEYFKTRNWRILSNALEPRISYQRGVDFRTTLSYRYTEKRNLYGDTGEKAVLHKLGIDSRLNSVNAGTFNARFNVIRIDYNAPDNSQLAYELLEGLKDGDNYTWGLSLLRSLGKSMQLTLNYDGRKSTGSPVVHTGGVQFRAFF